MFTYANFTYEQKCKQSFLEFRSCNQREYNKSISKGLIKNMDSSKTMGNSKNDASCHIRDATHHPLGVIRFRAGVGLIFLIFWFGHCAPFFGCEFLYSLFYVFARRKYTNHRLWFQSEIRIDSFTDSSIWQTKWGFYKTETLIKHYLAESCGIFLWTFLPSYL